MNKSSITEELLSSLPKGHGWGATNDLYQFEGFWCGALRLEGIISFQQNFEALDTDLIIATLPRSGTLWLKSLVFSVINRSCYRPSSKQHPLLMKSAHDLVPYLDYKSYYDNSTGNTDLILASLSNPICRVGSTHVPYKSLPENIKTKNCKIVYMCRNPKDNFVSAWQFFNKWGSTKGKDSLPLEEAFDLFCNGVSPFGPYWDHVLGYWKQSLETPENLLFLKYEDMKKDSKSQLKRLAEFLGYPFSIEEESEGVMEEILCLCSFEHLKNLDVNKYGVASVAHKYENKILFRKGEVGDWRNHLTSPMVDRLDRLINEKFHGCGLVLEDSIHSS